MNALSTRPKIGIIILNWNGCSDTLECLESLYKNPHPLMHVYVADNGSKDNSVKAIRQAYPQCSLLEFGKNYGFAEGNNKAVEIAMQEGCELILLLNNDTIVDEKMVEQFLLNYEALGPRIALGANIAYFDEPELIWDSGALWDQKRGIYHKVAKGQSIKSRQAVVEVDHIIGCALLIPSFLIREIGLFDPRFFLNYEETDWCVRAKRAGVRLYSLPHAILWHKISRSFVGGIHNSYFTTRNRGLWLQNFTFTERMRWYWLEGQFLRTVKNLFKVFLSLVTLPLWIGFQSSRKKNSARLVCEGVRLVAFYHHLIGRYGDCPDWVKTASARFRGNR